MRSGWRIPLLAPEALATVGFAPMALAANAGSARHVSSAQAASTKSPFV